MDLREEFVLKASAPGANLSALCREYGVSRKTGHKWVARFRQGGPQSLRDMSRRPHRSLKATDGETVLRVIEARGAHPRWGPKKLRAVLLRQGHGAVPTVRTIARILLRAGEPLVRPRRRRAAFVENEAPRTKAEEPNALWTVDFKGWWHTGDGKRCEPLTARDAFSRFVLCARILRSPRTEIVKRAFERLFEARGLPTAIQVDNGAPFTSARARAGLTRLSAWWVSLGIRIVRSRPGCPQDNGGHERMHGDMYLDLELAPADDIQAQQAAMDRWVEEFNHVRPHEALAMKVPADLYRASHRRYRGALRPCYPAGARLRRVTAGGHVKLDGRLVFVGSGFAGYDVALHPVSDGHARVLFYDVELGHLSLETHTWLEPGGHAPRAASRPSPPSAGAPAGQP